MSDRSCPGCEDWLLIPGDLYCGGCGRLALELEVRPEEVKLVASVDSTLRHSLMVWNRESRPLEVELVADKSRPWLIYSSEATTVEADQKATFRLELLPDSLPDTFRQEAIDFRFVVNSDPKIYRSVPALVKSGPKPFAEPVRFGELQEGTIQDRNIVLGNRGGMPFRLLRVEPVGSKQLRVGAIELPVIVNPSEALEIPVFWDTQVPDEEELSDATFRLHLAGGDIVSVPTTASLYRYRLQATPPILRFEGTRKGIPHQRLDLRNLGSIDVGVAEVRSTAPWLRTDVTRGFSLRAPDGKGDSQASRRHLQVKCHAADLEPGTHKGSLEIVTTDDALENCVVEVELRVETLRAYQDYVGIDFGTTNSVVSVLDSKRQPELVEVLDSHRTKSSLIPSVLVFKEDSSTVIGHEALAIADNDPDRSVSSIKRIMGYDGGVRIGGEEFSPEQLAARIMSHLVAFAEQQLYMSRQEYFDVRRAIVTVPANFYDLQIQDILAACQHVGIDIEAERAEQAMEILKGQVGSEVNTGIVLDEPSAAALYFIHFLAERRNLSTEMEALIDREQGMHLLVFDYGGGTLDISVAQITRLGDESFGLRILVNRGDNQLGGDHLDVQLIRDFLADALAKYPQFDASLIEANRHTIQQRKEREGWSYADWILVMRARQDWKRAAERLKVQLTYAEHAAEKLSARALGRFEQGRYVEAEGSFELRLDRTRLEDRLAPSLEACGRLVSSTLDIAELEVDAVDFILHAGRQSLMPAVQDLVNQRFPQALAKGRIVLEEDLLKTCVAKGAVLYGKMRHQGSAGIRLVQERRLPHSYGIDRLNPFGLVELEEVIGRGETYPIEKKKVFEVSSLAATGLFRRTLFINRGSSREVIANSEVSPVGELEFQFDPKEDEELVITFSIDINRRLVVQAKEKVLEIKPARPSSATDWMG